MQRNLLLTELRALEGEALKLNKPLARSLPVLSTGVEVSGNMTSDRVLDVASRDKRFGDELVKSGLE